MIPDRRRKPEFRLPDMPFASSHWAACGAGGLMLAVAVALWLLSRPSDAETRLAALEKQAAAIQVAARAPGDLERYPPGTVCTTKLDDGFKAQLTNALSNSGFKVEHLDLRPGDKVGERRPLQAYAVTLRGSGSYEQAMTGLDLLARQKPHLFVDSLSLRNRTDSVTLNLEGRLFCRWTSS